jgi:hypothetical protein
MVRSDGLWGILYSVIATLSVNPPGRFKTLDENEYYCEACRFLDEDAIPCSCEKGHGRVAYRHAACEDFNFGYQKQVKESTNNGV